MNPAPPRRIRPLLAPSLVAGLLLLVGGTLRAQGTYGGREPDAAWRAPAAARIEQWRKSDFRLRVVDATGRPVAGATVAIAQRRHAFPFGSALVMSRLLQDTPANLVYRQKSLALFNAATTENDLKWPPWIGEWGASYGRPQTLAGLRWLRDRGFALRGHVFVWPGWKNLPNSIQALRGTAQQAEIPRLVLEHIADEAAATRDLINEWDVQNEPFDNKDLIDLLADNKPLDLRALVRQAPVVMDRSDALSVLRAIRSSLVHMALVFDEYGHFEGVVTPGDVLEAITGAFRDEDENEPAYVKRADHSWIVSGWMPVDEFSDKLGVPVGKDPKFETVAGYVLSALNHLPRAGETFTRGHWRFEVMELDGHRIDKVLVERV